MIVGVTDTRDEFHDLMALYLPVLTTVGAIVVAAILFAVVRYRRRPGREPSGRSDHKLAESIWVLVVAAIVAGLVWATFTAEARVDRVSSDPGLRVDVTAFKWQWRFDYAGEDVPPIVGTDSKPAELVVPEGTTVRFTMTSRDVIHAFWVPALRFKRDAFPRRETEFDLVFDRPGRLVGRCAEFCGFEHAEMTFDVRVLTETEFRGWLAGRRRGAPA